MAKKSSTPPEGDYEVGYRRPPKQHQFKKGASGNPSGRRKGVLNSKTVLSEIFSKPVMTIEAGQQVEVNAIHALFLKLMSDALKGNMKAGIYLANLFVQVFGGGDEHVSDFADEDAAILAHFLRENHGANQEDRLAGADDSNWLADHEGRDDPEMDGGGDGRP